MAFGIKSDIGRDEDLLFSIKPRMYDENPSDVSNTSIFDPVLTELMVKWFSKVGSKVLDPFAGGSVRGIVSAKLGRKYTGIDLAKAQIEENRKQAKDLVPENLPKWIVGNSSEINKLIKEDDFDFLLTCPPYGFLEVYSKDPNDLSNMTTENFNISYRDIIKKSCDKLNDNRFAAIVVGEYRDKQTTGYVDFIGTTVDAFRQAGLNYYNELILINVPGSAPLRVGGYFDKGRDIRFP